MGQSRRDGGRENDDHVKGEGDGDGGDPLYPNSTTLAREEGEWVRGEEKRDSLGGSKFESTLRDRATGEEEKTGEGGIEGGLEGLEVFGVSEDD